MHHEELEIVSHDTNELTGIALPRHEAISQGAWCRSTNVFVINNKGEVLCHQRSLQKERFPGVWSTHLGGHVAKGENYETNAVKELEEEAGIISESKRLVCWRTTKIDTAHLWVREFVTLHDVPAESLKPQPGEVDQFAWKSIEEILEAKQREPHMWCAGTHDFRVEYHCLRAVLTAAHSAGAIEVPHGLQAWHPVPSVA
jgi:isopentenyldiphosphate isomerase